MELDDLFLDLHAAHENDVRDDGVLPASAAPPQLSKHWSLRKQRQLDGREELLCQRPSCETNEFRLRLFQPKMITGSVKA